MFTQYGLHFNFRYRSVSFDLQFYFILLTIHSLRSFITFFNLNFIPIAFASLS